jgi:hypothetical protein
VRRIAQEINFILVKVGKGVGAYDTEKSVIGV